MLIRNKKTFSLGVVFAVSFLGVLLMIFSPIFEGKTGLQFADDSFNKLSKGSSYFIPKVSKTVEKAVGTAFSVTVSYDKPEDAAKAAQILTLAGAVTEAQGVELSVKGDLGTVLKSAIKDSDAMFNNKGEEVSGRYGYDEKQVMKNWWTALGKIEKKLKKEKLVAEAKTVSDVNKKAVEPGYNFYHIESNKVSEHAGMLTGLLVFYVAYTMWWGFAIFYLFEGIGLTMKKAKVKKEA